MRSCKRLNAELSRRLLTFFKIFRDNAPKKLQYHFGFLPNDGLPDDDIPQGNNDLIVKPISNDELKNVFDQEEDVKENITPKLLFLYQTAKEIAESTFTESDCSIKQLTKNLISLIGQKSVEMNLLAKLASMTSDQIQTSFDKLFSEVEPRVELDEIDIVEAAELIRRSRMILMAFQEAQEFENNFVKVKSKIPRTFFHRRALNISTMTNAMIYVLHYIADKVTASKHVKQSLKKNTSFRAFAVDMNEVLVKLTSLGVLTTEQRIKRARVLNPLQLDANEVNIEERRENYFKILFDINNNYHKSFLETYQVIYPGQIFYSDMP